MLDEQSKILTKYLANYLRVVQTRSVLVIYDKWKKKSVILTGLYMGGIVQRADGWHLSIRVYQNAWKENNILNLITLLHVLIVSFK